MGGLGFILCPSFIRVHVVGGRWNWKKSLILLGLIVLCWPLISSGYYYIFIDNGESVGDFNYFLNSEESSSLGYLVDSPNCHILNVSAFHPSVLPFIRNLTLDSPSNSNSKCTAASRGPSRFTYINESSIVINASALHSAGYSRHSISCCYIPYNRVADNDDSIEWGARCKKISSDPKGTLLDDDEEFLRVLCTSKYWPWSLDVIYRAFHAVPRPLRGGRRRELKPEGSQRPNVLLLGIDSMSRLSFVRNMPKSREYLRAQGAVEMLGYTKLGENTFPNAMAFMTGHTLGQLSSVCNYSDSEPIDPCPFIWKDFRAQGYATAFVEDVPFLATYNYEKVGFRQRPVDYYLRPFMLGVNQHSPRKSYFYLECMGHQTVDEMMLDYLRGILEVTKGQGSPAFIYAWLTNLAHGDLNAAQAGDDTYLAFLKSLNLQESNTVLFFMSDHGYRYGDIRQTFAGWYEDKLPNMWVYLPPSLRHNWSSALVANSRRLTSPLDLHSTFRHILNLPSERGASFFSSQIPQSRSCADAGIPPNFCACAVPSKLELSDSRLRAAATAALTSLNAQLPPQCAPLALSKVVAGGMSKQDGDVDSATIIVAFDTIPGSFLFEGSVVAGVGGEFKLLGELLRMNKISTDVSCVKGDLEKFCYCAN